MPRVPVLTRSATPSDLPGLLQLWGELRQVGARAERAVNPTLGADVAPRLQALLDDPDSRVLVAEVDGEPVGMAVAQRARVAPLSDVFAVQLNHVVVADGHRHRGVGHALVAAAAAFADESGVEHVVASAYPSMREVNRFYARLGFAPVVVRRIAPLPVLRRRLVSMERAAARLDLVRRRARLRAPMSPVRALERTASETLPEG